MKAEYCKKKTFLYLWFVNQPSNIELHSDEILQLLKLYQRVRSRIFVLLKNPDKLLSLWAWRSM